METRSPPAMAKKLWQMVRVVYYMLRKGMSKRKLMMDLHLLLKRSKLAGKAFGELIAFHLGDSSPAVSAAASSMPFYDPKEVEFSCSNTPSYAKKKNRRQRRRDHVEAIAKAFEILSAGEGPYVGSPALPTPSPIVRFGRSPVVRQLRVTDSPFPIVEEEAVAADAGRIDEEADEFIKRFYEELRRQHLPFA